MEKFTPGPWTAHGAMVDDYWPVSAEYGEGSVCIARVTCDDDIEIEESRANAFLIAAAPDLLTALQAVHDAGALRDFDREYDMVMAAIAKALLGKE